MPALFDKCLGCQHASQSHRGTIKCSQGGQRPVMVEYMLRTGDPCGPSQKLFVARPVPVAMMQLSPSILKGLRP